MSKPTPTPWIFVNDAQVADKQHGRMIANCNVYMSTIPENAANAAFIVKAVNNHDALVEALKAVDKWLMEPWTEEDVQGLAINPTFKKTLLMVRETLKAVSQ